MLKILFSPSEGKFTGGLRTSEELLGSTDARYEILKKYNDIVLGDDTKAMSELVGLKKESDCNIYKEDIFTSPHIDAIERYSGVAYKYLDFTTLTNKAQDYLRENCIIFSNLYGPILGGKSYYIHN